MKSDPAAPDTEDGKTEIPCHEKVETYGGGHIRSRHGRVDGWLCIVYLILFIWAIYYGFTYWGGLGPGLDY